MLTREPIPNPYPVCYGQAHDPKDVDCKACKDILSCAQHCEVWEVIESLDEMLFTAERQLIEFEFDPQAIYATLYAAHFGKPCHLNTDGKVFVARSAMFCVQREIEFEVYVASQMRSMRPWLETPKGRKIGFQPNMLFGEKAFHRYEVTCRRAKRQTQRADSFHQQTAEARVLARLVDEELHVGEYYVASYVSGNAISFGEAVEFANLSGEWKEFMSGGKARTWYFETYGPARLAVAEVVIELRAVATVAGAYQAGLTTRIGFKSEFTWKAFAELMASMFDAPKRVPPNLDKVPGKLWKGG